MFMLYHKIQVSYKSDEECVEQYGAQQYVSQSMTCIEEAINCLVQVLPVLRISPKIISILI